MVYAAVILVGLAAAAIVTALLISRGGDEGVPVAEAPQECVERWNDDENEVLFGAHIANAHGYGRAQVAYLDVRTAAVGNARSGDCVVILAASGLDPEPGANAQIHYRGKWQPLSELIKLEQLGVLRSEAASAVNATIDTGGRLSHAGLS